MNSVMIACYILIVVHAITAICKFMTPIRKRIEIFKFKNE